MTSSRWIVPAGLIGLPLAVLATALLAGCGPSPRGALGPSAASTPAVSATASPAMSRPVSAAASPEMVSPPAPTAGAPTASPARTSVGGPNAADIAFARMMIPHHLQAIDMAILAQTRAGDQWIRDLAAGLIAIRDPQIRTLKGWLDAWGTEPLPRDHRMPGMLPAAEIAVLAKASGPGFDRLFVTMMIKHHQGCVRLAEAEQADGSFAGTTSMARALVSGQRAEIKEMRGYLAMLG